MPISALNRAKHAFVSVLLSLASTYGVSTQVNRESEDQDVLRAYSQVLKKGHPDHGGDTEKFQRLQTAKEAWSTQREKSPKVGAPFASADDLVLCTLSADGPSVRPFAESTHRFSRPCRRLLPVRPPVRRRAGRLPFRPSPRPAVYPLAGRENVPRDTTPKSQQIRCSAHPKCNRCHMTQMTFTRNAYRSNHILSIVF